MRIRDFTILAVLTLSAGIQTSYGQAITVQQPAVSVFSLNTVVSVPDRGWLSLGGVGRAASGRNSFGPLRSGTNTGLEREAAGMDVGVQILDLREMDQALLDAATRTPSRNDPAFANSAAEHAWNVLSRREAPRIPDQRPAQPPVADATRFERLALQAERRGEHSVARLHWRMAARHGSATAEKRLRMPHSAVVTSGGATTTHASSH